MAPFLRSFLAASAFSVLSIAASSALADGLPVPHWLLTYGEYSSETDALRDASLFFKSGMTVSVYAPSSSSWSILVAESVTHAGIRLIGDSVYDKSPLLPRQSYHVRHANSTVITVSVPAEFRLSAEKKEDAQVVYLSGRQGGATAVASTPLSPSPVWMPMKWMNGGMVAWTHDRSISPDVFSSGAGGGCNATYRIPSSVDVSKFQESAFNVSLPVAGKLCRVMFLVEGK